MRDTTPLNMCRGYGAVAASTKKRKLKSIGLMLF